MNRRFLRHIVAPTIAISILLLSLGILAAWNVQRQQASVSQLVNLEFHNTLAAQDLLLVVNDIRQMLRQYLREQDSDHLEQIVRLKPVIDNRLKRLSGFARAAETFEGNLETKTSMAICSDLQVGKKRFYEQLEKIRGQGLSKEEKRARAFELDDILNEAVQRPLNDYIKSNEQAADRTNEANRQTANKMFEAFLLLGVCGGAAGLVAGLAIARGVHRSMVKLDVSVRGAADRLQEVIGPAKIASPGGIDDLATGIKQVEDQIGLVIERLQEREQESMQNQKFAAVGQLAAGLAHELRNPLMPMKMLVQRALSRPDGPSLSVPQLKVLDEEIRRMEGLVHEFLDFAKPQALQPRRIDLTTVIRQATELVAARANVQHVELSADLTGCPVEVLADPLRIRQVILNLLLNSLDAQPEGGSIDIRLSEEVLFINGEPKPFIKIDVDDSGTGIPENLYEEIFEPFMSTKETGTGLGLTISRRIILNHGGQLKVANTPQGGAGFIILLPQAVKEPEENPED